MSHHAVPYSASTSSLYCDEKLDVLDTLQRRSLVSSSSSSSVGNGESDSTSSGTSTSAESEFRRIFSAGSSASIGGGSSGSNGSNKGKSNADSSSTSTYNGLGDSTTVWRKLQGLMQEEGSGAAAGIVTRRNSDGGVERVVDIANVANPAITAYEKGGIFSDSDGEEMMSGSSGSMIESLVLQSAKDVFGVSD